MEEGKEQALNAINQAPSEVQECIRSRAGTNIIEDIRSGKRMPGPDIGNYIQGCFQELGPQSFGPGEGEGFGPDGPMREGEFGPGEFPRSGEEGDFPEGMRPPFRPDPSQFRSENGATPFFGQDKGVPNPQDPVLRDRIKKELEGRGLDPAQFNEAFSQPSFDSTRVEGDIRRQTEEQIRRQIEEQIRGGFPSQGGFPPQGGEFRPPEGGGFFPSQEGSFGDFRPPEGGTFSPPPSGGTFDGGGSPPPPPPPSDGGAVQQGGNLLRAVKNTLFLLWAN